MGFYEKLNKAHKKNQSLVCVGLDPVLEKIPSHIQKLKKPIFEFNKALIDQTHDLVCAFKPQIAYYASHNAEEELELTISYIKEHYSHIPVILDSKRNDIGSTAKQYAIEAFERYQADAITVSPYMGGDSLEPFLEYKDKGVIVLCRTSNPGGSDIQNLKTANGPLYLEVAKMAANKWNQNQNIALVVGATFPEELKAVREVVGDIPLLVPGVGAQGGSAEDVVKNGLNSQGQGLIINSSRAINYASSGEDFAQAAREVTAKMKNLINQFR